MLREFSREQLLNMLLTGSPDGDEAARILAGENSEDAQKELQVDGEDGKVNLS